jgi:hypothetical protein
MGHNLYRYTKVQFVRFSTRLLDLVVAGAKEPGNWWGLYKLNPVDP